MSSGWKNNFNFGCPDELIEIKLELKLAIKSEKAPYSDKIEDHFKYNNWKRVRDGMRLMRGHYNSSPKCSQIPNAFENYANELDTFHR